MARRAKEPRFRNHVDTRASPSASRLLRAPLARQLEDALRDDIVSGSLAPGTPLKSADLSRRYQVSATPAREALVRLATEGFVQLTAQRTARVAAVALSDVANLYEIRMLLEPLALRRTVAAAETGLWKPHLTVALQRLRAATRAMGAGALPQREASRGWSDAHRAFHFALYTPCGSEHLLRMITILYQHAERYRMLSRAIGTPLRHALREHEEIYRLAFRNDADAAAAGLRHHLAETVRLLNVEAHAGATSLKRYGSPKPGSRLGRRPDLHPGRSTLKRLASTSLRALPRHWAKEVPAPAVAAKR